ncbi:MAG: AtpZ/AtpI family protein [Nitrospirae bacterium]|nr:AtpZ/AtpI family protein [Nitrospirota bacterium]
MIRKQEPSLLKHLAFASNVGLSFFVSVLVGVAMGLGLDRLFNSSPYLTIAFLVLGTISGFIEVYRIAKRELDKNE